MEPSSATPGEETVSRILDPQFSFADLELKRQGVQLDPTLRGIAEFLDQHSALAEKVRLDLVRGLKKPTTGRSGITPSQTLRSLILMRVKNWDYRELRERINDGYTLRTFTDFDSHRVPQHDAFNRAFNRLTPTTMQAINRAVVQSAVQLGLEDGKQLRVDTTVVETDIHYRMSRVKLVYSAGANPARARVRGPVAWIVRRKGSESRKSIDKAILGMGSESSGRNESKRIGGLENVNPRGRALGNGVKAAWNVAIWPKRRDTRAGEKRQHDDKDAPSNWRSPPRPAAKSAEHRETV